MIINEWQLNTKLNTALQHTHRADFALYLALLSPAVDEFAEFFTPEPQTDVVKHDIYKQLDVKKCRPFELMDGDIDVLAQHSQAFINNGFAQLKLASYLTPPPLTQFNDKARLDSAVWQNLSLHSRRRLEQPLQPKPKADPAALYEVLQKLNDKAA